MPFDYSRSTKPEVMRELNPYTQQGNFNVQLLRAGSTKPELLGAVIRATETVVFSSFQALACHFSFSTSDLQEMWPPLHHVHHKSHEK